MEVRGRDPVNRSAHRSDGEANAGPFKDPRVVAGCCPLLWPIVDIGWARLRYLHTIGLGVPTMTDSVPPGGPAPPVASRAGPRAGETSRSEKPRLRPVYDFGLSGEEVALRRARKPLTEAEIAAMIVDEDELKTLGRWGGSAAPSRGLPGRWAR